MTSTPAELETTLAPLLARKVFHIPDDRLAVGEVRRLTGGANQETWLIGVTLAGQPRRLVLRRAPGGQARGTGPIMGGSAEIEAAVMRLAEEAGVAVPHVPYVLTDEDALGTGYFMDFIEGETIARKILRDDAFAAARPKLARQCGEHIARVHQVPRASLPEGMRVSTTAEQLAAQRAIYDTHDYPHPVFEVAFRWLEDRLIEDDRLTLVHGDFRHGNLIIGLDGVRAIIDWEGCHLGDPMEDLGWICVNSWRFGVSDKPVGGFGTREELFEGYEAAGGGSVDPERVKFWELFGTLKWGVICMSMVSAYKSGLDKSVERATIGRRSSETEIDLLNALYSA